MAGLKKRVYVLGCRGTSCLQLLLLLLHSTGLLLGSSCLAYVQTTNQEGTVRSHAALVESGHSLRAASALHICCIWDLVSLKGRRACWSLAT